MPVGHGPDGIRLKRDPQMIHDLPGLAQNRIGKQDGKLLPAPARRQIRSAQTLFQPFAECLQNPIAFLMTVVLVIISVLLYRQIRKVDIE